jgi:ATP-binding cassette subfamily B protein
MRYTIISTSRKIEYELRNDFFSHLLTLPMSFYHEHRTGDLMARATNDLNAIRVIVGPGIMFSISNSMLFIFVISFMFYTNVKLTLFALLPLPLITLMSKFFLKHIFDIFKKVQEQYSDITSKVQENIAGVRVVKAYVQEESEAKEFETINKTYLKLNLKLTKLRTILISSLTFLMGLGVIILIWFGGILVVDNTIKIGDFVAFLAWLGMLAWPMISFGWIMNMIQQGAASMGRINEIMDTKSDIKDDDNTDHSLKTMEGAIEFCNINFAYNSQPSKVLENINIKIPRGKTLAITGPTGSGKTTFVNLISRMIEPQEGRLLIDGIELKKYPLQVLRKNIGYVPQETFLFSESITENISFGIESPSLEEVKKAAVISTINRDLKDFPDEYETVIGERGITLSGGQKQRTALSRAIIRKPKILILDDAFSSVDSNTEENILDQFRKFNSEQTNIIISQRISTIKNADIIIIMDEGKIIEQGTHKSLLKAEGFYADLYRKQLLEEALEQL